MQKCPKCNSEHIWSSAEVKGVMSAGARRAITIKAGMFVLKQARVVEYVCLNCGYVEGYMARRDLEELREL